MLRGHIYWIEKLGPNAPERRWLGIVMSPDRRNLRAEDVIVVPCSLSLRDGPWHVRLDKDEGGLPDQSVARCDKIVTIPKRFLGARPLGGRLTIERMYELERCVLRAIGIP